MTIQQQTILDWITASASFFAAITAAAINYNKPVWIKQNPKLTAARQLPRPHFPHHPKSFEGA